MSNLDELERMARLVERDREDPLMAWDAAAAERWAEYGRALRDAAPDLFREIRYLRSQLDTVRGQNHRLQDVALQRGCDLEEERAKAKLIDEQARTAYMKGRIDGREEVAKYARAIGEIEDALGLDGAQSMRATVDAVRALQRRVANALYARDKAREELAAMVGVERAEEDET